MINSLCVCLILIIAEVVPVFVFCLLAYPCCPPTISVMLIISYAFVEIQFRVPEKMYNQSFELKLLKEESCTIILVIT